MKTSIDLNSVLLRDKIDKALESLYLETPRRASSKSNIYYGIYTNSKPNLSVSV